FVRDDEGEPNESEVENNFVSAQKTVFLFNLNKLDTYGLILKLFYQGNKWYHKREFKIRGGTIYGN
ncbi:hypothetical protein, partial [Tetragenococcus muriaticus]|uniref:hypothetical protein n=1 Tax=Tetragenococcus muriaticus TaxID=64642 RepID=UPI00056E5CFF